MVANGIGQPETVWLNNGGGGFTAHPTRPSFGLGDSGAVSLGDLDGDGDLDAVVANAGKGEEAETVWLNDGGGRLTAASETSPRTRCSVLTDNRSTRRRPVTGSWDSNASSASGQVEPT